MSNVYETVEGSDTAVKKTATVETITANTYEVPFLIEQYAAIIRQRDEQVSAQNRALADVVELLREAAKLEIPEAVEWDKANPVPQEEEVLPIT